MKTEDRLLVISLAMATLGRQLVRKEPMRFQEVEAVAKALEEYEKLSNCYCYERWQDIYAFRNYVATQK